MQVARSLAIVAVGAATFFPSTPAAADMFGLRAGYYTQVEKPFVGVELLVPLSHSVFVNPNVEYVFAEDRTYMTFNADFHYDFPTHSATFVWAGAGLGVLYSNPEGPGSSSTDVGANFIFGVGRRGPVVPYIQAKLIAKNDVELVVAAGLRF